MRRPSSRTGAALSTTAAGLAGAALWWRRHPSACPYGGHAILDLPRPGLGIASLLRALDPQPGERMLEIGPGSGRYTLPVAAKLNPDGSIVALDLQADMLALIARRAVEYGAALPVETQLGDATALPFAADSFDGAFLVTVLGEIPDREAVVRELARVVRPGGRIVLGEILLDPHYVTRRTLARYATAAELAIESIHGAPLAYYAVLRAT